VGRVFDRRQVRAPFAHPDLTQPERVLRYRLQQICLEKNGGRHWVSGIDLLTLFIDNLRLTNLF
jgi:hypothetical protein